jgi:hypothetical protein
MQLCILRKRCKRIDLLYCLYGTGLLFTCVWLSRGHRMAACICDADPLSFAIISAGRDGCRIDERAIIEEPRARSPNQMDMVLLCADSGSKINEVLHRPKP